MPLNTIKLQNDLLNFFKNNNRSPADSAMELAKIISEYIKSATVVVTGTAVAPPGIPTAGSPAAQATTIPIVSQVNGQGNIV